MKDSPVSTIDIQWLPSHLAEPGNEEKRSKYSESGLVCNIDILGNDQADELAKKGADMHASIDYLFHAAADRKKIAVLAQKMYIALWDLHITACD